jgi:hypothetical protein
VKPDFDYSRLGFETLGGCSVKPFRYASEGCRLLKETGAKAVLDLTFGPGRMWQRCRPDFLFAVDVARREWKVEPDAFVLADMRVLSIMRRFDVVVFDPPFPWWRRGWERREYAFYGDPLSLVRSMWEALPAVVRQVRPHFVWMHLPLPWRPEFGKPVRCEVHTNKLFRKFPSTAGAPERIISATVLVFMSDFA